MIIHKSLIFGGNLCQRSVETWQKTIDYVIYCGTPFSVYTRVGRNRSPSCSDFPEPLANSAVSRS